jgi:hypothetical protein
MSDPADLAPSRDPAAYGKRPLLTAGFFAWVSLCLICVLAGVGIGKFGLPGQAPKPATAAPPAAVAPPAQTSAASPNPAPAPIAPAAAAAPPGSNVPDQGVADRLARLESASNRIDGAAAEALAAATLSVAANGSGGFDQDLAAFQRVDPNEPELAALRPLAAQGAPSRAELAAQLPALADQATLAARDPGDNASFLAKVWALVGKVVVVRRLDPGAGGVDGALARAEDQAADGDLAAAAQTLQALPAKARAPLEGWIAAVGRRLEIDRLVASLRARALAALATPPAASGSPS